MEVTFPLVETIQRRNLQRLENSRSCLTDRDQQELDTSSVAEAGVEPARGLPLNGF
jgi:hypothetical protein